MKNQRFVLASRPDKVAGADNFRLEEVELPVLAEGELLVRNDWLSLDPYMRGRMDDVRSYSAAQALDETMVGGTAGQVLESRHPKFRPGDQVVGRLGWQRYGVSNGAGLRKVDTSRVPLSAYLGVAGMPGVTAWVGLNHIIEPREGETVVVSAASGAVGSVVGQLAKFRGCRVVGIAGGPDKCGYVNGELGFDACVDYKSDLAQGLRAVTPDRVDGLFENVGGAVLDSTLARMNAFGRVAVCGLISSYDGAPMPLYNFRSVLVNRLKVQGFIVTEFPQLWPPALAELTELVAGGRLKYRESIAEGLESAPEAFLGMLKGRNFGKQLVRLG